MHWNALRYCIGFPPELWYDIADEEGFLIQDEFPIWTLGENPKKLEATRIVPEYTEWMRERWNHPCVVIWDAQNESSMKTSGEALRQVRHLDLSNRPWENGWAEPQSPTDWVEAHPYLFIRDWSSKGQQHFKMSELAKLSGVPGLQEAQRKLKVPIIINEYAWLWLTRDGIRPVLPPTCTGICSAPIPPWLSAVKFTPNAWPPKRSSGARTVNAPACFTSARWVIRARR